MAGNGNIWIPAASTCTGTRDNYYHVWERVSGIKDVGIDEGLLYQAFDLKQLNQASHPRTNFCTNYLDWDSNHRDETRSEQYAASTGPLDYQASRTRLSDF